jgi:eukaryotic-like serine/threonine-protein kinase
VAYSPSLEAPGPMNGFFSLRRSFFEALFLGLVATGACHLPPVQLAARIDRALYDLWSQLTPPEAPTEILLIRLDEPAWLAELARLANEWHARLLITTMPQPAPGTAPEVALGPVEIPIGEARLRRTDWQHGGHLWFRPDIDGVVRHEWPSIGESESIPSLALSAATALAAPAGDSLEAHELPLGTDALGRRWLRFYSRGSFTELTAADLLARPEVLRDKVLIAGRAASVHYATPVGEVSARELLAHTLAGYRQNAWIDAGRFGPLVVWATTLTLLLIVALRPLPTRAFWWCYGGGTTIALLLWSSLAFAFGSLWLPVASAAILTLSTMGITGLRSRSTRPSQTQAAELTRARRLAASSQLEEAWLAYRQIPPSAGLLAELYDLASALESTGQRPAATDLFHRVAQVDAQFRDVAQRLVRSTRAPSARPADAPDGMPRVLGRYQLLEAIGRGAMGNVYLGRDPKINRIVAIKAVDLALEFEASELDTASQRFLREAETAGRLSHPNIVTIYDVGENDGLAYIAMEYLRGRHLSEFAAPDALLPVATVLELLSRTADALDYAHAQNVVHRDIKPANIMYDSVSDGLKITDFGIARLIDVSRTSTGIVLGTPAYMSPEQLEGKNVNGHTDLFALGVSLYQLLTGQLPFRGASMTKLMFVIANEPHKAVTAVRSDLPSWLNDIVDRALAKDPQDRFQSGAEMAAALRAGAALIG